MTKIYHLADSDNWEIADQNRSDYVHPSLQAEGFIHCSSLQQLAGVLDRYFKKEISVYLLEINPQKLMSRLVEEPPKGAPASAETFPHIYGPLNHSAVTKVTVLIRESLQSPWPLP